MKQISLFDDNSERIHIGMGLAFLVFVLLAMFFKEANWTLPKNSSYYLLAAIWGTGHTVLTMFLLFWLFFKKKSIVKFHAPSFFWMGFTLLMVIVLGAVTVSTFSSKNTVLMLVAESVLVITLEQHALGQIRGLSLMYNQKIRAENILTTLQLEFIKKLECLEKKLFIFLTTTWVCFYLALEIISVQIHPALWVLLWAPVILILILSLCHPWAHKSNKTLYLTRLILFPLGFHFRFAFFAIFFLHGLEYQLVFTQIFKTQKKAAWLLASFTTALLILTAFTLAHRIDLVIPQSQNEIYIFIALAVQWIDYSHYLLDAILFRKNTFSHDLRFI